MTWKNDSQEHALCSRGIQLRKRDNEHWPYNPNKVVKPKAKIGEYVRHYKERNTIYIVIESYHDGVVVKSSTGHLWQYYWPFINRIKDQKLAKKEFDKQSMGI